MIEAFFGLIGALAIAAILVVRMWPWALAASAFVLVETAAIWLLVAFYGRVIKEIRRRKSG